MIKAALTGGIASGKTEVLKVAKSFTRVRTIQADNLAKEIYNPDNPCFDEVVELFGSEILTDEGKIDLGKVSDLVFSDQSLRKELERISHPYVKGRLEGIIGCLEGTDTEMVLVEIPLLFQSTTVKFNTFDTVILVLASEEDQLKRLVSRDGITVEQARERIELQRLPEKAEKESDYVIKANGTLEETRDKAKRLIESILN
ncbi:MAG: dephospho-CoA kinase [Candidatus Bipolaricaulia bacterium]